VKKLGLKLNSQKNKLMASDPLLQGKEKERYTHLNAEIQRITRRDKKAFLSE